MKKYQIPDIPEEERTPLVEVLLLLLEQFASRLQEQDEIIVKLKDEINILKGEKKRPVFKGSKLEEKTKDNKPADQSGKRPGSKKKDKTAHLTIHNEEKIAPESPIPKGSRFKGYREFVVQDIRIQPFNTRYRLERWLTPAGEVLMGKLPGGQSHFGSELISYILHQHYHCHTTQPLLLEQLHEWGVDISAGQINHILTEGKACFHHEKDQLLPVGLSSPYISVDDSGARHCGKNGYVTQIGNNAFAWFSSTFSKSRINFLELLCAGHHDYHLNDDAFCWMQDHKLPVYILSKLQQSTANVFTDRTLWQAHLNRLGITVQKHIDIATEGALFGSVLHHYACHHLAIISDDAGQFNAFAHGLCWIHTERLIHKLTPFSENHKTDQAKVRGQVWDFYKKLKAYKKQPCEDHANTLEKEFDTLFTQRTTFATLNQCLKRIYKNKDELLLVLARPEVPLHTNDSERDIRDYVKKRKISAGTRSDEGRRCRDTFISLKKTCRKLGVSFWAYLKDRLTEGDQIIPYLPDLAREKITAHYGPPAPGY